MPLTPALWGWRQEHKVGGDKISATIWSENLERSKVNVAAPLLLWSPSFIPKFDSGIKTN